jgi:dipeptidyl-peptidase 4
MYCKRQKLTLILLFAGLFQSSRAQQKELTDDQYVRNTFTGITQPLPQVTRWIDDTRFLMQQGSKTLVVTAKTGMEAPATDADTKITAAPAAPRVFSRNNDLFIKKDNTDQQLTRDAEREINPTMSPDNNYVAYTKKNDLYTIHIPTGKETRLTTDGSEVILNGYASWIYFEEILGRPSQYRAFWWSPDSKKLAFFRSDDTRVPVFTITDGTGQHGLVEQQRYPKVGDPNPEVKIGIIAPDGGAPTWCDFNEKEDQYFGMPYWTPDGSTLLVQWMNRLQNNLIVYSVNPATGSKSEFYTESQPTWISLDDDDRFRFLDNGKGFLLMSDATGWRHIYFHDKTGKRINAVTSGQYSVTDINAVDEKAGVVYFTARSRENSARRDFYRVNIDGKKLQRLSFGDYSHTMLELSPGFSYFITRYSNSTTPEQVALVSTKGKLIKVLGNAKGAAYDDYRLAKTELLRVKSEDGLYDLPMKVTWPLNMEPGKRYPVLISIYGGPGSGTCNDVFGLSGIQQWYAKEGLIQVVMDHRGSGHFGKEGMNYMYRNLGYWETKDYSTMVKWLIANGSADPAKIAITGFSYGGYMSCYALTYGSAVFTHGMAGGSVTDWTLYDSHYTERYMGTPANNPEGYKNSSVFTHIDKYKGNGLQLVHGVIDDNVHFQNTLQLVSRLQDAKKEFEFMAYPGGRHGWSGAKGAHFQNLKTKFIYRFLLEKPVAPQALR